MKIITGNTSFRIDEKEERKSCVAIGKFDGIHVGHSALLAQMAEAKKDGFLTVVFTFSPSPYEFFSGEKQAELMTTAEKRKAFEKNEIDFLWEFPLNSATAAMEPVAFIRDILADQLKAGLIVAGDDLSFGDKGAGDADLLKRYAATYDYEVNIINKVCILGKAVSSTYVRNEVRAGNMENAAVLLGKPYSFTGRVLHGNRLGRRMDMPTVNLIPEKDKLLPPFGVYYSRVLVDEKMYDGITNIGRKPTVSDEPTAGVETYLYDFDGDLYGREIEVMLLSYKRPEKQFENVEALAAQLKADKEDGKKYFGKGADKVL